MSMSLYITNEELKKLRDKEIGRGKDGAVLKFNHDTLIKIYHKKNREILTGITTTDESDVKIYIPKQKKDIRNSNTFNYLSYIANEDNDGVIKIASKEALYKAIEKQKYVKRTNLPKQVLYVDGRFSGCVLQRTYGIPIHKLTGILPKSKKKKILLEVLISLNELFDNYIYHCDLSNSPYEKVSYVNEYGATETINGHSHVLVNPFTFAANIIDLDGKSTIYTERYNEQYMDLAMANFSTLVIEFLLVLESEVVELSLDTQDTLRYEMEKLNLKAEYIEMLISGKMTPTQAEDVVRSL